MIKVSHHIPLMFKLLYFTQSKNLPILQPDQRSRIIIVKLIITEIRAKYKENI